ncbi:MFS transporter [Nocardia sp. NPDC005998]|uniref:MFS transporter n=1 Tax=Nocardia sp. NPDC005998 TaxID=3156894 RepID=UPI0033A28F11
MALATPTALSANSATTVTAYLADDLGVNVSAATWVGTAFGWGVLIGTPLTTSLLQTRGLRTAIAINTALVLLGAALVAAAPALPVLLVGRSIGAAGSGGLVTIAISIAGTTRRTGAITASVGLVGAFGPLTGSVLSALSWRLPLILAAVATLAVPSLLRRLPRTQISEALPRDHLGIALVLGFVTAVVLIPRAPLTAIGTTTALAIALAVHIVRNGNGFVPQAVLRSRRWITGSFAACTLSTVYFVLLYTIPHLLRTQWSPDRIGLTTLLTLTCGAALALLFTRFAQQLPAATVGIGLPAVAAVAAALPISIATPAVYACSTALAVFASSAGMAWYATRITEATPPLHHRTALSLYTLAYQLGGAIGPAIATVLLT